MEDGSKGEEYHDPDYPEPLLSTSKEENSGLSDDERIQRIRAVVRREFANELKYKEEEIDLIDKRMSKARRMLHQLRFAIVNQFYMNSKLMLSKMEIQENIASQQDPKAKAEVSKILRDEQKRIHPSVRKLLGEKELNYEELFSRKPPTRNKSRKDYSAMLKNYTVDEEKGETVFAKPETSKAMTKRLFTSEDADDVAKSNKRSKVDIPNLDRVLTIEESTRNKQKQRYRIIIGNTSKYAPASSAADKSTHKWLLYVRGPRDAPDVSAVLEGVTVTLHHTYAPHNRLHIQKPPYHLSRRGWGEFPAKIEMHFKLPHLNRPITVEHIIKLDRQYTGVQTLGSETVVDVWLYSDAEMLKYEYKEEYDNFKPPTVSKPAPEQLSNGQVEIKSELTTTDETWSEFESSFLSKELNVDDMLIKPVKKEPLDISEMTEEFIVKDEPLEVKEEVISEPVIPAHNPQKRLVKYVDPNTGKIYYLEMDKEFDIDKVQGIVINALNDSDKVKKSVKNGHMVKKSVKKGVSLLKPEFQVVKSDRKMQNFTHFHNDHCYMGVAWTNSVNVKDRFARESLEVEAVCEETSCKVDRFEAVAARLSDVRQTVQSILRKLPLINKMADKNSFRHNFPFVVASEEKYWELDSIKRRNIEWSRAKLIRTILERNFKDKSMIWSTKQILTFGRYHGYHPIRKSDVDWTSYDDTDATRRRSTDFAQLYGDKVSTISIMDMSRFVNASASEVINLTLDDVEIDVCGVEPPQVKIKKEPAECSPQLEMLPLESEDDRLRCYYIERKCAEIGIELRNEDVGSGYTHSAVHKVLFSCLKLFAEDLIRSAVCRQRAKYNANRHKGRTRLFDSAWDLSDTIELSDVFEALKTESRLKFLTQDGLAAESIAYDDKL